MGCGTSSLEDVSTPVSKESPPERIYKPQGFVSSRVSQIHEELSKIKEDVKETEESLQQLEKNSPVDLTCNPLYGEVKKKIALGHSLIQQLEEELSGFENL